MVNTKIDKLLSEIEGLKELKKKLCEMKFEEKKEEKKVTKKTTTKSVLAAKKKIESSSSEEEDIYFEDELDDPDEKPVKRLL